MKKIYALAFLFVSITSTTWANNYATPGTGVKWTLTDLVANAGGDVTFVAGEYFVNDTIFIVQNDTLTITNNAVVKFIAGSFLDVNGTLLINPPTSVKFTAQNTTAGFLGVRIDSSNTTVLRKLTFEYANALRLFDCNIVIDSCLFRYNSPLTTFGNAAISLFRANPIIINSSFIDNQRAAIQGGSNINNAPKIYNCLFQGNNTTNQNVPQINLGATSSAGGDTVKIINNQILRASTNSGGIGFLPLGNLYAIVSGNIIRNNRYGLTFNGGSNINAVVSYNVIDSNNTQNDPNLGGSGISFTGGSATSHQNTIVAGNTFRANLWGITIQNFAKPNLGDLSNADTTDDGKNQFINNTNATTPGIDLYNNSPDPIMAQNNFWNTAVATTVENKIFHQPDNIALGLVNYTPFIASLPITLKQLVLVADKNDALLTWQTSIETNSSHFTIEKSRDGQMFVAIGIVNANATSATYRYVDFNALQNETTLYYRLKMLDKDGKFAYSPIVSIKKQGDTKAGTVKVYPTIATPTQTFNVAIMSDKPQHFNIQVINASGQLITTIANSVEKGKNIVAIKPAIALPKGQLYFVIKGENFIETVKVVVQ
jgi:hypothetical protein